MDVGNPPTLKQLQSLKAQLLEKMEEARLMFPTETKSPEFLTGEAALKHVEELIETFKGKEEV